MRIVTLALVLAVTACGGGNKSGSSTPLPPTDPAPSEKPTPVEGPPPPMTEAELETLMRKSLAMFKAMSEGAEAAAGDCAKLATSVEKVIGENRDLLETAKRYKGDADVDKRTEAWTTTHKDEVAASLMKFGEAANQCGADPAFQAAMGKLDL